MQVLFLAVALALSGLGWGCSPADQGAGKPSSGAGDTASADGDSDSDSDSDTCTETDSDSETGFVVDGGADAGPEVIEQDCSACPAVGSSLDHMVCALDLCDEQALIDSGYQALTGLDESCALEDTYEAVEHFGSMTNDLAPVLGESYALMATGPAEGTEHSVSCDDYSVDATDPFSQDDEVDIHDAVQWSLLLRAPEEAQAFRFKYVFFSEEYDDYIGSDYNDRFYAVIEAGSTNAGSPTVINFTDCREPDQYVDFVCGADDPGCVENEPYCYIAVNSAYSDCCWYNGCPEGYSWDVGTDISGTGYECSQSLEDGPEHGSSTGWLQTAWPIEGSEVFSLTFHLHDTEDGIFDSEVILDAFEFLTTPDQGTVVVE